MLDNAAAITFAAFGLFIVAYFTYGRFLARRVFRLDADRVTPAHELKDGIDYVPTRVPVLFGHHFASIAGLGPILGPAIAVIWGWVPAVLWVVFGCIFIGAVHDLGALRVSLRYQGRSIGDVCRDLMGPRARLLALLIIFFLMSVAMGAFVDAISSLFVSFRPDAVIPSFGLMVVAMGVGIAVYKFRSPLGPTTMLGLLLFAGLIFWGVQQPIATYPWFAGAETRAALQDARAGQSTESEQKFAPPYGSADAVDYFKAAGNTAAVEDLVGPDEKSGAVLEAKQAWIGGLLLYGFIASVLPVWLLLQPRDYINSFQLYFALATMLIGLAVAACLGAAENKIDADMLRPNVEGAPSWYPFLFVTIACGAVSGFHALVSSGTTVRQINRETDALTIGYGAMLTEGALAILVIMACVAGLGAAHWQAGGTYATWSGIKGAGLAAQLNAVVHGGANFLAQIGISTTYGRAILSVTIVAFAMTTLDSAVRLLRFNVEEICRSVKLGWLANRYFASLVAVAGIAFFGLAPLGKELWILFGMTNQLLAGLTLLTVSVFLFKLRRPTVYTVLPMLVMFALSMWAMVLRLLGFFGDPELEGRVALISVASIVLAMSIWLIVEALLSFARGRGGLEIEDDTVTQ